MVILYICKMLDCIIEFLLFVIIVKIDLFIFKRIEILNITVR